MQRYILFLLGSICYRQASKCLKVVVIIALFCSILISPSVNGEFVQSVESNSSISKKLVGTWIVDRKTSEREIKGVFTFLLDGTFCSQVTLTIGGESKYLMFQGKWTVNRGTLVEIVTRCNDVQWGGEVTHDKVLRINEREFSYITEAGDVVTRKRKSR